MTEEWRPIPGFCRYQASGTGQVRVVKTGHIKVAQKSQRIVDVRLVADDGRAVKRNVGAFVLLAFVGPAPAGMECSHLDGDPWNNRLENLAWESHADNMARKREHATTPHGDWHALTKVPDAQVRHILDRLAAGERAAALAREYGVSQSTITRYKNGVRVVARTHP